MQLEFFQVDAFAEQAFEGNPAAVYLLTDWLPDETLQKLAMEHNLSETTFVVTENGNYRIRWFTPAAEVDLCGHATLAAAHVLFQRLETNAITFESHSGPLHVRQDNGRYFMDFPKTDLEPIDAPAELVTGLGYQPLETYACDDLIAVVESEQHVADLRPNLQELGKLPYRGIVVTAQGSSVDFVSRFFAPRHGIDEDPVTGSSHCALTPYWAGKLKKTELSARQLSARGGNLSCKLKGDRVGNRGNSGNFFKRHLYILNQQIVFFRFVVDFFQSHRVPLEMA